MSAQGKPARASPRYSVGDVPMSVFNPDLQTLDKPSSPKGHWALTPGVKRSGSRSSRRTSQHRAVLSITPIDSGSSTPKVQQRAKKSLNETQNTSNNTYTRPIGRELVSSKHPSCSNLPPTWTYVHDRFIAYLATHAPLDKNGKIPRHEEKRERWRNEDIAKLVMERFPEVGRYYIKVSMIEKRLALLDQAENDYFKISYGAYVYEEWGRGI